VSATALGAIIAVAGAYAASIFAIIWYLGGRIDRLDDRISGALDKLDTTVHDMQQDVVLLKGTR
jgi:hypothetical protein